MQMQCYVYVEAQEWSIVVPVGGAFYICGDHCNFYCTDEVTGWVSNQLDAALKLYVLCNHLHSV